MGSYISQNEKASMTKEIFSEWSGRFIHETTELRSRHTKIELIMDGFGGHMSFSAISHFHKNGVFVVALPAHSSQRTQLLDFSICSSFKNSFNDRILGINKEQRNDIFTLCEMMHKLYSSSLK